jgi:hypothetical protein
LIDRRGPQLTITITIITITITNITIITIITITIITLTPGSDRSKGAPATIQKSGESNIISVALYHYNYNSLTSRGLPFNPCPVTLEPLFSDNITVTF